VLLTFRQLLDKTSQWTRRGVLSTSTHLWLLTVHRSDTATPGGQLFWRRQQQLSKCQREFL